MVLGGVEEHANEVIKLVQVRVKIKIRWSPVGFNFNGAPIIIAGTKIFHCQHGKDRKVIA